jgi:hypothetical protein
MFWEQPFKPMPEYLVRDGGKPYGSLQFKGTLDSSSPSGVEGGLSHQALHAVHAFRYKLNGVSLMQSLFGPWLLFVSTLWLLSSWMRYYHPHECNFLVVCLLIGVLLLLAKSWRQGQLDERRWQAGGGQPQATWLAFLAVSCTLAFLAAVVLGEYSYDVYVQPFFAYKDLSVVKNVDPRITSGTQFMDASIVLFKNGSFVDVKKSLAYKYGSEYCVAPIAWGPTPFASYEFWAVGKDCCNPYGGAFWCGGAVGSATAHAGVRVMDDALISQYRLAVQQAQAQYKDFTSQHPLFVTWTEDPTDDTNALRKDNPEHYVLESQHLFRVAIATHLVLQALAVLAVVSIYTRLDWLL